MSKIFGAKGYRDLKFSGKAALVICHILAIPAIFISIYAFLNYHVDEISSLYSLDQVIYMLMTPIFYFVMFGSVSLISTVLGRDFVSAYFAVFRSFGTLVVALVTIPAAIFTYGIRRRAWGILQSIAMGLDGYQLETPQVMQIPSEIPSHLAKFELVPAGPEERALSARNAWIGNHLGDVSQTFSKLAVDAADITSLLKNIEADQSLVHGAYYSDDECIARIADWISGKR